MRIGTFLLLGFVAAGCNQTVVLPAGSDAGAAPDMRANAAVREDAGAGDMAPGEMEPPDAGEVDAGDAGPCPDETVPVCSGGRLGLPCVTDDDCCGSRCQPELPPEPPTPDDPMPRATPRFPGGFCTIEPVTSASDADCLEFPGRCGDCMTCLEAFPEQGGCFLRCDPAAPGNGVCPDGWDCAAQPSGGGACVEGCSVDADCFSLALIREETNGIPGTQTAADCDADPSPCGFAGPDALRFITSAMPTCNTDTFECEWFGRPGAEAGDPCRGDVECETGGRCLAETAPLDAPEGDAILWPGGHCFGPPCESDMDCAGDAVCGGARSEVWTDFTPTCLVGCDLTTGVDADDPATWPRGRGGCPEGYLCLSDADSDVPERGVCFPDRARPLARALELLPPFGSGPAAPNLGADCTTDAECFSPFGFGRCLVGLNGRDGYCTVDDAAVLEVLGFDVCGAGASDGSLVVGLSAPPELASQCLVTCGAGDDCLPGFACVPSGGGRVCFPTGCADDGQCRADESCIAGACFSTCTGADSCAEGLACAPLDDLFPIDVTQRVCFDGCVEDAQCREGKRCVGATEEEAGTCQA